MLALGVEGGRVIMVDEETGEEKWEHQAHSWNSGRTQVAMSPPDGRFVATGALYCQSFKLFDAATGEVHRVGATHDGTGACICEVDDVSRPVFQEGCPVVAHTKGLRALAFSPCGQRLATGGGDGAVILWVVETGEAEHRMQADEGAAWSLVFSADGARLACGNTFGSIQVWDAATGALLRRIPDAHDFVVSSLHFTDSRILASAGSNYQIHLWDVDSGEKIRSVGGCRFAVWPPDGRALIATARVATTSGSDDVQLVDAESGALRVEMFGHKAYVSSAVFVGRDGRKLASGSHDGTCKVWDSSTGGALLRTIAVGNPIYSVAWGRDWLRDTQCAMPFAMGHHPRLGQRSHVLELEAGVVQMILDRV